MGAFKWMGGAALALTLMAPAAAGGQAEAVAQALQAAQAPPAFTPPDNGRLTLDQIKMYIAVRRRAIAAAAKTSPDDTQTGEIARVLASLVGDAAAADEAGADVNEYRWVSARIAEADPAAAPPANTKLLDVIAAAINRNGDAVGAPEVSPAARAAADQATAARIAYNRRLIERYRTDLDSLRKAPRP